jgi:hypothetical protein
VRRGGASKLACGNGCGFTSLKGFMGPPENGLGEGSGVNPGVRSPKLREGFFFLLSLSSSIFFSQMDILLRISSTLNCMAGRISATASKRGLANMFMKPI